MRGQSIPWPAVDCKSDRSKGLMAVVEREGSKGEGYSSRKISFQSSSKSQDSTQRK